MVESSIFAEMLPNRDISELLMSPAANKQDVIVFDRLMQATGNKDIRIASEPLDVGDPSMGSKPISMDALDQLESIQNSTQNHFRDAIKILASQANDVPLDMNSFKTTDPFEATAKLHQAMQRQSTDLLKAQMHMNLFTITISIVNRVANSVNEGLKTLYRQQG